MDNLPISKSIYDDLTQIRIQLSMYLSLILCILGLIGFIGNLFTYLQPELRYNTCCIYSLVGSVVDIINLMYNLFPTYLSATYNINMPMYRSSELCKMQIFLLIFLPQLSISYLLLAIIDRFAATCTLASPIRKILQVKFVPIMIVLGIIISFVLSITGPMFFERTLVWCESKAPLLTNILYIVLDGLIQPILMIIVVLLTYRNIHQSHRRVVSIYK